MINVNGEEMAWHPGMTVQNILSEKGYTFRLLAVWINDQPIERTAFSTTPVPDNANVQVAHMISGG